MFGVGTVFQLKVRPEDHWPTSPKVQWRSKSKVIHRPNLVPPTGSMSAPLQLEIERRRLMGAEVMTPSRDSLRGVGSGD